jgi:hypothetical protein
MSNMPGLRLAYWAGMPARPPVSLRMPSMTTLFWMYKSSSSAYLNLFPSIVMVYIKAPSIPLMM